ncbi:MAG: 3-hydroxyacyl-CoA dehydrogenase family protein [Planctomycetota bacterium]|nr:3-hydroxyacyl-CoA dehydrogenase family protein [Planctomycetota bacterium]
MKPQTIGVAGLGLLGRGIAACCLGHGHQVIAFTRSEETHVSSDAYIEKAISELIEHAGFSKSVVGKWRDNYTAVTQLEHFRPCDFVIETVAEDQAVKRGVFDSIESVVGKEVPIATNTSAIPITTLQRDRKHPHRFVGMHWAEPAHVTRFCELIRGEATDDNVFNRVAELARLLGKEPCRVEKDIPAFIVNRIAFAMYREAVHILEMGVADAATIDTAYRNAFGLWATICGPLRWMDITGGPASYAKSIAKVLSTLDNREQLPDTLQAMIDNDCAGASNGRGFYNYTEQDRRYWDRLLLEHAWTVRGILDMRFPIGEAEQRQ